MTVVESTTVRTYPQKHFTFILTPTKIAVMTIGGQKFFLSPKSHYFNRRMMLIRAMIELGEIRDFNELAGFCANGNIAWIPTSVDYLKSECH